MPVKPSGVDRQIATFRLMGNVWLSVVWEIRTGLTCLAIGERPPIRTVRCVLRSGPAAVAGYGLGNAVEQVRFALPEQEYLPLFGAGRQ